MTSFPVSPVKQRQLLERMKRLGVRDRDLEEQFVRSSGPGGQRANKASTCVLLKHRPTGLEVKCQQARSQGLNRFFARRILLDKIERKRFGALSAVEQRIERIRRQKRQRAKRAEAKYRSGGSAPVGARAAQAAGDAAAGLLE